MVTTYRQAAQSAFFIESKRCKVEKNYNLSPFPDLHKLLITKPSQITEGINYPDKHERKIINEKKVFI